MYKGFKGHITKSYNVIININMHGHITKSYDVLIFICMRCMTTNHTNIHISKQTHKFYFIWFKILYVIWGMLSFSSVWCMSVSVKCEQYLFSFLRTILLLLKCSSLESKLFSEVSFVIQILRVTQFYSNRN